MSPETYSCFLRLKSTEEEDAVRMQPGSGETHVLYVFMSRSLTLFLISFQSFSFESVGYIGADHFTAFQTAWEMI